MADQRLDSGGAANGVVGLEQFALYFEEVLKPLELGFLPVAMHNASCAGVGGSATPLFAARVPLGVAGLPGDLQVLVVAEEIPFLLPSPLLRQLGAQVDHSDMSFAVNDAGDARRRRTELLQVDSQHVGLDLRQGLEAFQRQHSGATR